MTELRPIIWCPTCEQDTIASYAGLCLWCEEPLVERECANGHPWTEENRVPKTSGGTYCRPCMKVAKAARRKVAA